MGDRRREPRETRLRLLNPHSALAALETRPGSVHEVGLPPKGAGSAWSQVEEAARAQGVPVRVAQPAEQRGRQRGGGPKSGREGGAYAEADPRPAVSLDELLADPQRDGGRGLWLALDRVQDPRNLGAVVRAAAFFGVAGLLLTRDGSAPLSSLAYDVAAGGLEYVPHAWVGNLTRDLATVKEAGIWVLGASERGDDDVEQVDRARPWLLIVGNEEKGLRRLTLEGCDQTCRLVPQGQVGSLNVSVAAAVLLSTLRRA